MSSPPGSLNALSTTEPAPLEKGAAAPDKVEADLEPTLDARTPQLAPASDLSQEPLPFQSWNRYKIVSFLGAGGMGTVYKALDPRLNRSVAIKFLRGSPTNTFDTRQRRHFEREARTQAGIEHPHICRIYEVGEIESQPYIVMQLIHGSSMGSLQSVLSREEKVRAIQKVAEALHAAHAQKLIHRDIKPGNILVERRDDGSWWPYLLDFGLARELDSNTQTSTGGIEGTPAFMAPEQARGETRLLDARTDVYGLGATLYSLLAGRPPFVGNSTDVLLAVLTADPPRLRRFDPGIPEALEIIVQKCLEKEPLRRYASAEALAEDLQRFLEGARIKAQPPGLLRQAGRFAQRHKLMVASAAAALVASLILGGLALRIRWQAAEQARLAERLGQEIKDMEWLLRSARQMPLHDLEREKKIVRKRMAELQAELASYGPNSRGLAHYALGRGHMALHAYSQALPELEQAIAFGVKSADVYYALGFVIGKHFEQAMYEARLSGGGDWAQKQLKELAPRYLTPAIAALKRSRSLKLDTSHYLEGLLAYYQRDYDAALKYADAAVEETPWLYEAYKLAGDVHLERALQARDKGLYEQAEREFANSVKSYETASTIGQSDGEVYEGLAEAWVRHIELARDRGQSAEAVYLAAIAASDKLLAAEPQSVAGSLKIAFAALLTLGVPGAFRGSVERVDQCLSAAQKVLEKQPDHPYATEVAADCHAMAAEAARTRGEDPEPRLQKALSLLVPVVQKHPRFLWGLADLGLIHQILGVNLQLHGSSSAKEMLGKSIEYLEAAIALDPTHIEALLGLQGSLLWLLSEARSEEEVASILSRSDRQLARCKEINSQKQQCFNNYFQVYTRAAQRALLAGQDPQPRLKQALENLAVTRRLGGSLLDAEQHAALAHLVEASARVQQKEDPASPLFELQEDLHRCFALAAQDAPCRTFAAQAEWVRADWLASQNQLSTASLETALKKAELAIQSPEVCPDAWQTLAETHLRLARVEQRRPGVRAQHVTDGLAALERLFAINASHVLGLATQGALLLSRAQAESDMNVQKSAAQASVQALERAFKRAPYLMHTYAPVLDAAQGMAKALEHR